MALFCSFHVSAAMVSKREVQQSEFFTTRARAAAEPAIAGDAISIAATPSRSTGGLQIRIIRTKNATRSLDDTTR